MQRPRNSTNLFRHGYANNLDQKILKVKTILIKKNVVRYEIFDDNGLFTSIMTHDAKKS